MDCKCRISPRRQYKDFIHICTECSGGGGHIGNVCHKYGCSYLQCIHSNYYTGSNEYPTAEEYWNLWYDPPNLHIETQNSFPPLDHYHFPSLTLIDIHKKFSRTLKEEMVAARLKLHEGLMKKVFELIELKTGRRIGIY